MHLKDTPAILFQANGMWYVFAGKSLTVLSLAVSEGGMIVEYLAQPIVLEPSSSNSTTSDVREICGNSGALVLASIDTSKPIRSFNTLEEAVAVARPYKAYDSVTDYIVGGSASHPLYYVVTISGIPPPTDGSPAASVVSENGPPDSRIWVRV